MKKDFLVGLAVCTALVGSLLAFKAADPTSIVYTPGEDGRCTVPLSQLTTVEVPPNPTTTLPSATTEFDGTCTELEVWFTP